MSLASCRLTVEVSVKATDEGTVYGSVSNSVIAEALKEKHNIGGRKKSLFCDHIKELGEHKATVQLQRCMHRH